jgi:hypothetical protein
MPDPTVVEILKSVLVAVIRHLLSIAAAWLISKGMVAPEILSDNNILVLAGGVTAALISLGWIVYNKLKVRNLVEAAREAAPLTPITTIKENAAAKPLL